MFRFDPKVGSFRLTLYDRSLYVFQDTFCVGFFGSNFGVTGEPDRNSTDSREGEKKYSDLLDFLMNVGET